MNYILKKNMDGITAIIINKKNNKILFLKRRCLPFIVNPCVFSFVSGKRKYKEKHINTAYREVYEETKLSKNELELKDTKDIFVYYKKYFWKNKIYVFATDKNYIKINIENSDYKWVYYKDIPDEYLKMFIDKKMIRSIIENAIF
ncbi:MAG: NUDIX domain-containing protein [Candidatus Marsarchaeota archaeon]|nr:NUDIX domain-containing protein [Candidatus Marsarchaeota archaeon]